MIKKILLVMVFTLTLSVVGILTSTQAYADGGHDNRFEFRKEVKFDDDDFRREIRLRQDFDRDFERRVEFRLRNDHNPSLCNSVLGHNNLGGLHVLHH